MDVQLLLVFAIISGALCQLHGVQGPVFLQEPPSTLTFSNTSGSQVSCSVHGSPAPQVEWLLQDGSIVTAVPGLRQSLGNGTLYFPPFRAQDYRKEIHATQYRCRASNLVGTILSRDVNVRAVVRQHYDVQVYRAHVLAGNTAVLSCVIPSYVKEHVTVTSWFRDDSILLPGRADMGGRYVMISGTGDLHIRSARPEDGLAKYSCLTLHSLTQERKRSVAAMLTVTEATGSMPPRLAPRTLTAITVERGSDVHLSCSAQGNPPPTFTWYRQLGGQLQTVVSSSRLVPIQDILYIRRVEPEDSGQWSCKAFNNFGEQRLDTHLTVTAHLNAHVTPQLQVVNSGESATFNCTVSGSPVGSVQWLRNGEPLVAGTADSGGRIRLISPLVLVVGSVTRHDRGIYQCIVRNDRESAQGSAELRLGDTLPELQYTFIEQALRPGPHVSLRCSATGSPPPQFKWLLDGEPLSELTAGHRYAIGQYVDQAGDVISHLNITNVQVEDGGLYSCRAINSLGSALHSARLNIYAIHCNLIRDACMPTEIGWSSVTCHPCRPPFIRSIGSVKAVAGSDVTLYCPYSGYPISTVRWERRGQELPGDLRHRVQDSQAGGSLTISRVDSVTDSGGYTCTVTSRSGEMVRRDMQLIVHSPPVLEPFLFPSSLQEGGRAQVTCSVTSGDMPIHFTWYKDNAPVSASLQIEERAAEFFSMLIFKEVTSRHSGQYTCIASNSAARANYTAELMVKVAPQWTTEPQDVWTLLGNSVTVNCEAKGYPRPHITWLKGQGKSSMDYQPIQNFHSHTILLANGSLWIESVDPQDEGHYLCRAANDVGAGLTKVIYIGVNEPARFDTASKNMSSKRGDPATLVCQVYGDIPIDVTWSHNGNRLDLNNYRFTITEMKLDNGLKSQLSIAHTDRENSGVYRCQAENAFGRSDHLIYLAVQERPDPPVMLEVVEVSSRSVRLTWKRPFDGNSPVLGYLVQYQPLGTGYNDWDHSMAMNLSIPVGSVGTESVKDGHREMSIVKGLLPATAYTIRILAINNIDQSAFTDAVVVKTQEEAPIDAPQNLQVKSVGQGELFLSWQVPPRETWNGELLGYIVTWNEQGVQVNNSKSMTVKGWATTKVQLTGLKKFTRYDITVRTFNSVAAGPSSIPVVGTTQEGVPEAAPQHVACSQISSQSMKISWLPPPASQHGGLIQGYKVFYRLMSTDDANMAPGGEIKRTTSTETYLHTLHKYTNYSIKVLAYTNAGDGALSPVLHCTTEEDVPGPPANIKASALTGESILVSWLPPLKPNGRISVYTVYGREAGRVGQHVSHLVHADDSVNTIGLMFEVRNLKEHQLYEFWVSATTSIGEGEPTPIIAQATVIKAPSRIASFSQQISRAVKSSVLLPCVAVGNPTPRTRWLHRERPITFSPFYKVTPEGHLNIPSADKSLAGNYTCSAKNLFGEDEITYILVVLLPPGQPLLEEQYTTTSSVRLKWKHPDDGGTSIQGYTLSYKKGNEDWKGQELSPEVTTYTYEDLQCGTVYYMYLVVYNRVGNSNPSHLLTVRTKGGSPTLAKDLDLLNTNATTLQLNLFTWPDGGCPITQFAVEYRIFGEQKWRLVSSSVSEERLYIADLMPATWYQLRVTAKNDAGFISGIYNFATTTIRGGKIPFPSKYPEETNHPNYVYRNAFILIPLLCVIVILACGILVWYSLQKMQRTDEEEVAQEEEQPDEKMMERTKRRACQQVYTSSPVKAGEKLAVDDTADFRARQQQLRMRADPTPHRADSESEDTSGSPCNECSGSAGNYRVPVKHSRDIFRLDSSTESNELSPMAERRNTPRHVGVTPRRHDRHRPSSSSSSEDEDNNGDAVTGKDRVSGMHSAASSLRLQPPTGFSDSRELSEAECDRELSYRRASTSKLPAELATLLARYQEKKEQERKEFTIHV